MTKFLLRLFYISILFLIIIITVNSLFENITSRTKYYKLKGQYKNIICGHSRPETAYNDSIIADTKNIAQSGEAYFYTYLKLKKIIQANPEIKRVLIEFSENNINDTAMNDWIYGPIYLSYRYEKYSSIMSLNEKKILFKNNPVEYIKSIPLGMKSNFEFILNSSNNIFSFKLMGGYQPMLFSHLDSLKNAIHKKVNSLKADIPHVNIALLNLQYLDKIVALCKANNIELYFVRSPIYPLFITKEQEDIYDSILKNKYSGINLIDFSNYKLNDEDYYDFHHVDYRGSMKVSKSMDSVLRLMDRMPISELFQKKRMIVIN